MKRITSLLLAVVAVFQLFTLQVSAVGFFGQSIAGKTVGIDVFPWFDAEAYTAERFPGRLHRNGKTTENPIEQPVAAVRRAYEEVPRYYQISYPNIRYGAGTVQTHGSGIVALSMAATYLTRYTYLPDEMARWFAGKGKEDVARLTFASEALGLAFETTEEWQDVFEQLQDGKCIVIQLDKTSVFTDDMHFIVLKGMTEDGKILINDPCVENYIEEDLKEKYETGFEEADISTGFRYAWVYDKSKIRDDLQRYTEAPASTGKSRYSALKLTPAEKQLLARVVCVNGFGECEEGQQAMIEVILNRMLSDQFSDELKELVYGADALCEASLLNGAQLSREHYLVVEKAVYGPHILQKDVTEFTYTCHE